MKEPYLEVTYRTLASRFAAYLYLPRRAGDRRRAYVRLRPGLLVDFRRDGKTNRHRDDCTREEYHWRS